MKEKIYKHLRELGVEFVIHDHPPLFTCADHDKYGLTFEGLQCKNLFLRDQKKTRYFLVSMPADKPLSLADLAPELGEKKLSFVNETELLDKLGVTTGAVSVLNVIGAKDRDVIYIIDGTLKTANKVGFHPSDNTATVVFSGKDLERILKSKNVNYKFITI